MTSLTDCLDTTGGKIVVLVLQSKTVTSTVNSQRRAPEATMEILISIESSKLEKSPPSKVKENIVPFAETLACVVVPGVRMVTLKERTFSSNSAVVSKGTVAVPSGVSAPFALNKEGHSICGGRALPLPLPLLLPFLPFPLPPVIIITHSGNKDYTAAFLIGINYNQTYLTLVQLQMSLKR